MGWSTLVDMELDDDDKMDLSSQFGLSDQDIDYPPGLRFSVSEPDFEALGVDANVEPKTTTKFMAMATVMTRTREAEDCRVELQVDMLSLGDGPVVDLERKPPICLTAREIERLDLDQADAERGTLLHISGIARVIRIDEPRREWGGEDSVSLQVEQMAIENEEDDD
jgi:hypothetical protein